MSTHELNVEELVALALGDLDAPRAAAVEAGLSGAPEARRLFDKVRALVTTLQTSDAVSPPGTLVRRVKDMLRTGSAPAPVFGRLREVVASLVFDSLGKVAVAGFRGSMGDRQLAYSSEAAEIDVQVTTKDAERRVIRGQVTAAGPDEPTDVTLSRPGDPQPVGATRADQHGQFLLESPPGTYDLRIRVGDQLVMVPTLNVD